MKKLLSMLIVLAMVVAMSTVAFAEDADKAAAAAVDEQIAAIQVQEWTEETDALCAAAKAGWDALTDAQKALVEEADYFGRDTGDAVKDNPLNANGIGENELLVVSFGTSFNDSRVEDIGGIEKALQTAYPDWSVRRAFTAQIIINHIQARDLLGEVGTDATVINSDKAAVAAAVVSEAVIESEYDDIFSAAKAGVAFVFMGHGTSHTANVTYDQMQTQMNELGFTNVFIGTVEGEPEDTECSVVIGKVKDAGFKKVILRPLMVVAGDHANNDMADPEDEESWISQFTASGAFDSVECQIAGLGRIDLVQALYVLHTGEAVANAVLG